MKDTKRPLLLAAAQAGDERAFRQLVEPYRHALDVHCYRMLGSAQDAEDLVQETLLRAWRALARFEPRYQLQTWLYRIATNACLDELERRPRRPEPIDPFPDRPAEDPAEPTYDPAARYAIREGMELALLSAIQELPGRQRAIFIFRDVLGWTGPEVAEILDSTVASVNSALQRARATIDTRLPSPDRNAADSRERELLRRYMAAFEHDDIDGLIALLHEDAVLHMPPQRSLLGAISIATFFRDVAGAGRLSGVAMVPAHANGRPAVVIYRRTADGDLHPHGISILHVQGGQITAIDSFIDAALVHRFRSGSVPRTAFTGTTE
ncbi:MAG TPA: RNA polymerase subunit sigma-70 [Solirubrobacteraceae bacterium]|nr:RNA polymerase subunit sigma-70 [Solirubrobacteraceae bacterium]